MRTIEVTEHIRETASQKVINGDGSTGYIEVEKFPSRVIIDKVVQGVYSDLCGHGYINNGFIVFQEATGRTISECEKIYKKMPLLPKWQNEVGV